MKILKLIAIPIILSLMLAGCKEKKNPTGPNDQTGGKLNAVISGNFSLNFQSNNAIGLYDPADPSEGFEGAMQVQGSVKQGSDEYIIDIQVYRNPVTGTYQFSFPMVDAVASISKNELGYLSKSGSVTFTQVSKSRLVGTFNFTGISMDATGQEVTVTVASGTFDVPVLDIN